MSHLSVSDNDMDESSSECSHYSLTDLEDDEWMLRIPASEVRRQAKLVPDVPSPGVKYPHDFLNKERLPLKVSGSMVEYPLCLNGRYVFGNPGPARVIVNPSRPGSLDVVYHRSHHDRGFLQAKYRPKGYRRKTMGNGTPRFATPPSPYLGVYRTDLHNPYLPSLQVSNDMLYQQYYTEFWASSYLHGTTITPMLTYTPTPNPTPSFGPWGSMVASINTPPHKPLNP